MPQLPTETRNGKKRPQQPESRLDSHSLADFYAEKKKHSHQDKQEEWSFATQELLDSLPKIWTRGILYFLILFIGIILPWAMFSKVDEIGTARGRMEPKGKTVKLETPVEGTVSKIFVKEGKIVKVGERLAELDSELVKADLQQQQNQLEGQQQRLNQLELLHKQLLVSLLTQQQQNQAQALEKQAQVNQAKQTFEMLKNSYNLQKEEKLAQVKQAEENLEHGKAAIQLAAVSLENAQKQLQIYQNAWENGVMTQIQVMEKEDALQERRKMSEQIQSDFNQANLRLAEQQSNYERSIRQANSEITKAQLQLKEQENGYRSLMSSGEIALLKNREELKNLETDITSLKAEIKQTKNQIKALEFQLNQRLLKAPIEGTIFQLPIQRPGAVVHLGDLVAEIAPKGSSLILRAEMPSQDSGFIRLNSPVKIKFDAYPFQDYGIVEGRLTWISPDSKIKETPQGKIETFELEIRIDHPYIETSTQKILISPGQSATAEVIIRQRRVIDFVLDPFKKLGKSGLKL